MGVHIKNVHGAVSYTHLDVYKRQASGVVELVMRIGCALLLP